MKISTVLLITFSVLPFGCGDEDAGEAKTDEDEGGGITEANYEALVGTSWILRDPSTGDEYPTQKLKIEKDGDQYYALFSGQRKDRVARGNWPRNWGADVMRYNCEFESAGGNPRLGCEEQGRMWEWCMLPMTRGQDCTLEMVQVMDKDATEKDLEEAVAIANSEIEAFTNRTLDSYGNINQDYINLWNKVYETDRSKLGIAIKNDEVLDVMDTFVDFKFEEEEDGDLVPKADSRSNNAIVGWEYISYTKGDLLWKDCDLDRRYISVSDESSYPENPFKTPLKAQDRASYTVDQELTFTHTQPSSDVLGTPDDLLDSGCSFEFDAYHRGILVEAGLKGEVKTVEDPRIKKERSFARLQWSHVFKEESPDHEYWPDVVTLVITKQCPGKEAETLVSCQDLEIKK